MRTAILYIAARCNQDCVFCLEVNGAWTPFTDPTTREVTNELDRLYGRGARHMTFMGGETFFRKDLPHIIKHAKTLGFTRVGVTTNGTVLSKKGFIKNLTDNGLDFIEFSVHGHTPELANAIARTNYSFERQVEALAEINELGGPHTIVNVVVCQENKNDLVAVADFVTKSLKNVPIRFKFKFVSIQGLEESRAEGGAGVGYEDVDAIAVGDFLEAKGIPFWFYNFPLCRLGRHAAHAHETGVFVSDETYFDYDHRGGEGYYDSGHQIEGRLWPESSCATCTTKAICPGVEDAYRRAIGLGGLAPRTDDPLQILHDAAIDRGTDPSVAPARLAFLRTEPRPAIAKVRHTDVSIVRFLHDEEPNALEVTIIATGPDKKAFIETGRFGISYTPWEEDKNLMRRPRVAAQMEAAGHALEAADAQGLTLEQAIEAVAAAHAQGWTTEARNIPPKPAPAAAALVGLSRKQVERPAQTAST